MNERIKELAEQAGFYSSEYGNAEESFIKFAELIVEECAEVAAKVGEGYVKMGYVVPLECSNKIKQHFGVK